MTTGKLLLLWGLVLSLPILAAFADQSHAGDQQGSSLCNAEETVLFSCRLQSKHKPVSLCASKDLSSSTGYLQYRFGTPGSVELEFPATRDGSQDQFFYSRYTRHQVSKISVSFRNGGYAYTIFDVYEGESGGAERERGVLINRAEGKKKGVKLVCGGVAISHLGKLEAILSCDEKLSFGGCNRQTQ